MKSLNYRPEVNGLRGIAVLGTVFYHAEIVFQSFRIFPGGFLGVDVFFVISGYLMTSIILKEYKETQSFSFIKYYKRRIRRLVPALLLVIFGTSFFAYFFLLPVHFEEFIKSVLASIFFFSNFFFHFSGQAYGAQVLSETPLLHTWSLSVEEQFYIVYPLVLLGILIFMKKHIKLILIILILSSLLFASITSLNHQSFNFYMLPTRGWELLFGALLGTNIIQLNKVKDKKKEIFAIFGFLILLFSFAFLDNTDLHPTYLTLIPVVGTYLILQNTNKESLINRLLSYKILVFFGLISYSLYLWHHPIFSFGKIIGIGDKSLIIKLIFISISILLSFLTYRFVEKPFRNKSEKLLKITKLNILGASAILAIIVLYSLVGHQKNQYPNIAQYLYKKTWFETKTYFKPCFQRKTFFCSFNEKKNNPTVFLVGDSIMASIQEEMKIKLINKNLNFIPMTNGGCDFIRVKNNNDAMCNEKIVKNRIKKIKDKKESTIILHINYKKNLKDKSLIGFSKVVNEYLNQNYQVVLIYPIPQMKKDVSIEVEKNLKNDEHPIKIVNIDFTEYLKQSKKISDLFDTMNHSNLYKIYPHKIFCNTYLKNKCIGNTQDYLYFIDSSHLSKKGSELINMDLINIIDSIY